MRSFAIEESNSPIPALCATLIQSYLKIWGCYDPIESGPSETQKGGLYGNGQTATYRKTEGIQSYLRIWERYDPIKSGPSKPKKRVYMGVA